MTTKNERWVWKFYGQSDTWVRTLDGDAVVQVGHNRDEREANGSLIAAAPAMRAALERVHRL